MGRETKVGLLVGMCFIVCFAIILSRRGDGRTDAQPFVFEVATVLTQAPPVGGDAGGSRDLPVSSLPVVTRQVVPAVPQPLPTTAPQEVAPRPRPVQRDTSDVALADAPRGPREVIDVTPRAPAMNPEHRFAQRTDPIPVPNLDLEPSSANNRPLIADESSSSQPLVLQQPTSFRHLPATVPIATPAPAQPVVEQSAVETQVAENDDQQQPLLDRPAGPRAELARYVVQKGDTLSKIAMNQYGTNRPAVINQLYEANKDKMPSPHVVVIGRELLVPVLEVGEAPPLPAELAEVTTTPAAASGLARTDAAPATHALSPADATERETRDALSVEGPPIDAIPQHAIATTADARSVEMGPPAADDVHVVTAGETLSKIARHRYGSDSKPVVDALLAANRDRLRDKDRVVVGTKLVLPDLPSAGDMPRSTAVSIRPSPSLVAVTPEPAPAKPAASKKKAKSAQNSYELQRGDTYSTVAAKVLGTSKRWAEIEKLNKDIFPNAARIRPGVRIRLPRSTADDSDSRARPAR